MSLLWEKGSIRKKNFNESFFESVLSLTIMLKQCSTQKFKTLSIPLKEYVDKQQLKVLLKIF